MASTMVALNHIRTDKKWRTTGRAAMFLNLHKFSPEKSNDKGQGQNKRTRKNLSILSLHSENILTIPCNLVAASLSAKEINRLGKLATGH
jgi:hypothetical protein